MWQELPSRSLTFAMNVHGHALLRGDLLGAVLVDDVVVAAHIALGVAEGDLVLAQVALALGALRGEPGAVHVVAQPAQHRLDAGVCSSE
jgi:hypothetical protein